MTPVQVLLRGVLPAAVACALLLTLAWRPFWGSSGDAPRGARLLGGLAVALAYALGHHLLAPWFGWPPAEVHHHLPWLALAAALAVGIGGIPEGLGLALVTAVAVNAMLVGVSEYFEWSTGDRLLRAAVVGVAAGALGFVLGHGARRDPGGSSALVAVTVALAGTSVAVLQLGYATLAQLLGVAAAAEGAAATVALFGRRAAPAGAAGVGFGLLTAGLVLGRTHTTYELPWGALALLALTPALVAWMPVPRGRIGRILAPALAAALPVAAAVALAFRAIPPDSQYGY